MNRFTAHAAPSSPWNYDRRGGVDPTKSSFSASPKAGANTTRESSKTESLKNACKYFNNPSAYKGVVNDSREKSKQYYYDKASHPSR